MGIQEPHSLFFSSLQCLRSQTIRPMTINDIHKTPCFHHSFIHSFIHCNFSLLPHSSFHNHLPQTTSTTSSTAAAVVSSSSSSLSSLSSSSAPAAALHRGRHLFHTTRALRQDAPPPLEVFVNDTPINIPAGSTVLQACELAGVDVPRFCYHEKLSVAGNCRMCLVEVVKSPKPVASCAMPAMAGMEIYTDTPLTKKAREGVMEFLLANHPLDCPICDQGGECDLQDQSMRYGSDRSRYREVKRTVEDKNLGPLVKTVMTRCIHCTRCVRFTRQIGGVMDLGTTGRGNAMEIGTYVDKKLDTEMSGNVIDLCPVGALTSKPYAFTARTWELTSTESIDTSDAVGSNIFIDTRGIRIMRILPRLNEDINQEWISDKARFQYDGLYTQRLDTPMVKDAATGQLRAATWVEAFDVIKSRVAQCGKDEFRAVAGSQADAESIMALKDLANRLNSNNVGVATTPVHQQQDMSLRSSYTFNTGISGIDDADAVLIVGSNPRMEAPIICTRIRENQYHRGIPVGLVGPRADLAVPHDHLGDTIQTLQDLAGGKHPWSATLKSAERPLIIVGAGALEGDGGAAVAAATDVLASKYPAAGVSVMQLQASRTAALDLGFQAPAASAQVPPKVLYMLAHDDVDASHIAPNTFVIYQGHHGDKGAALADVILPGAAYVEKAATYVNTEGRVQRTQAAVARCGEAREDWKILRGLSEILGVQLPYDTVWSLRERMEDVAPHFRHVDVAESSSLSVKINNSQGSAPKASKTPLPRMYDNFFMTDPISRSSKTMAQCTKDLPIATNSFL